MIECTICHEEKPDDEFYQRANGALYHWCKTCHKLKTHRDTLKGEKLGYDTEHAVLDLLLSKGIYTTQGKHSQFLNVDLVSWGCVKIEVKSANCNNGTFSYSFSEYQLNGLCDCYIFVGLNQDVISWVSIIPLFEMHSIMVRTNLIYYNNPKFLKSYEAELFQSLIRKYRDAYQVIEDARLNVANKAKSPAYRIRRG